MMIYELDDQGLICGRGKKFFKHDSSNMEWGRIPSG
jgi:hypothetical protein